MNDFKRIPTIWWLYIIGWFEKIQVKAREAKVYGTAKRTRVGIVCAVVLTEAHFPVLPQTGRCMQVSLVINYDVPMYTVPVCNSHFVVCVCAFHLCVRVVT